MMMSFDGAGRLAPDVQWIVLVLTLGLLAVHASQASPDGSGQFVDSGQQLANDVSASAALGDIDNDGDLDAINDAYLDPVRLWLNDGNGVFVESHQEFGTAFGDGGLLFADFNGDGAVDLFGAQIGVWMNDGAGAFTLTDQPFDLTTLRQRSDSGDLDQDGDVDLFVCTLDGRENVALFNDGDGLFSFGAQDNGPAAEAAKLGDLDGDGDLDVFLVYREAPNRVWLNNGNGVFVAARQQIGQGRSEIVALGDVDGDGDLDAFVGNVGDLLDVLDDSDRIWLNDGSGFFTDSGQRIGEWPTNEVVLADLDDDGDLDAVAVANFGPAIEVWINDGLGQFAANGQKFAHDVPRLGVAIGDLDGDQDADVFYTAVSGGNHVMFNEDAESCAEDLNGDDFVGANDLLTLLGNWGADAPGADLAEPLDAVDAADLLVLLGAWGPCP